MQILLVIYTLQHIAIFNFRRNRWGGELRDAIRDIVR